MSFRRVFSKVFIFEGVGRALDNGIQTERHKNRQMGRQRNTQTDKDIEKQTDRKANRETYRKLGSQIDEHTVFRWAKQLTVK